MIRIGDAVICANPFVLCTGYGIAIRVRSKAVQTFVIQLAGPPGTCLSAEKAVRGRSYNSFVQGNIVSPEGGQILEYRTVRSSNILIN